MGRTYFWRGLLSEFYGILICFFSAAGSAISVNKKVRHCSSKISYLLSKSER